MAVDGTVACLKKAHFPQQGLGEKGTDFQLFQNVFKKLCKPTEKKHSKKLFLLPAYFV